MADSVTSIAIVGIGGVFPQADNPDRFWSNIRNGVDAARDVPPGRWLLAAEDAYDLAIGKPDHVYSKRGCFVDQFPFDCEGLNLDPALVARLDPVFHLALQAGRQAWRDARTDTLDRRRVAVVLGNIALPTDQTSALARQILGRTFEEKVLGETAAPVGSVEPLNQFIPGLPAALLAQGLGLGGSSFTLDAACASSLYALKLAADELQSGRADAMLTGGVSRPDCLYTQMGFSQLRALSPSGRCSPFGAAADGLVVGEGAGVLVLKRLVDALRAGDHIYAVIAGIGLSNDTDGGLLAPSSEGQLRAMLAAYRQAGWEATGVDLIECHATGTPLGDAVEFASLRTLWGPSGWHPRQCVIGSVKSNIGHTLTAAGSSGLLKVLLALRDDTLPPTAHFHGPSPKLDYAGSPFEILSEARPWSRRAGNQPRRAAISAFGFGGINAHVLLEEWLPSKTTATVPVAPPASEPATGIAIVGLGAHCGPWKSLRTFQERVLGGDTETDPTQPHNWWGVEESAWFRRERETPPDGYTIDELTVPADQFRIPPREMEEMLPQQILMLQVAAEAIADARFSDERLQQTGVFLGVSLDLNTTNFHVRWSLLNRAREWNEKLNLGLEPSEVDHWAATLREAFGPALTANRTMGALASIAASRIAREFHVGGPSFTISNQETSGLTALSVAVRMLRSGEIDQALVGAVDLPGDVRAVLNATDGQKPGDGAVAIVLKRVEDARRDGDRIYTILRGIGAARFPEDARQQAQAEAGFISDDLTSVEYPDSAEVGHTGAATGLVGLVRTALCLYQQILPSGPQFWLRNRIDGPRRASVACTGHGNSTCAILEEAENDPDRTAHERQQPLEVRKEALVTLSGRGPSAKVPGKLAFVFPGSGSHFPGMGRDLAAHFPEILRRQDAESERLRDQILPDLFWNRSSLDSFTDHRAFILGQVSFGTIVSDLLKHFGVRPDAVIGYSLGETAGLFALRAWSARDEMLRRMVASDLFTTELAGPCRAARRAWHLPDSEDVDWLAGVVACPAQIVRQSLTDRKRVALLIVNTPNEAVVGGQRSAVMGLVEHLRCPFFPLTGVSTVHCSIAKQVESEYYDLHLLPTTSPPGVRFYSAARASIYDVTRESAAESILAQALHGHDFPAVIEQAYRDGVRTFVEIGPGNACTRMIGQILQGRPHFARSASVAGKDGVDTFLRLLSALIDEGVPVDLTALHGRVQSAEEKSPHRTLTVPVGGRPFQIPPLPARKTSRGTATETAPSLTVDVSPLVRQLEASNTARVEAQSAQLCFNANLTDLYQQQLAFQMSLFQFHHREGEAPAELFSELARQEPRPPEVRPALDRTQCLEYAIGSIARVLGADFAEVDSYPTRVRLPDEPLMLVDRILTIEGEPRSLTHGRVVTEHDIHADSWYLDCGRIPTCIAVEAGQADLFLSGYLGIDFRTKGLAVYRLLDAIVTFHGSLPGPEEVIRYDIHIDRFFRQGETHLFRFRFEGTVNGDPLLTMREGCAGFFTAVELAAGRGVVQTELDRRPSPRELPADWVEFVPVGVESYDDGQIRALRAGDLAGCFGPQFSGLPLRNPLTLPSGRMTLVDRVAHLDPQGGRFGLGLIRAEADIHPEAWFLTCHFIDDRVMPGTLMYECCLHTLRIFLLRIGWVAEQGQVVCEPVPGVASRLKCRGQVIESTRQVTYEVIVKKLGYRPEPFAIVDALMYADGKPIVEITDMSLRLSGQTKESIATVWQSVSCISQKQSHPPVLFDHDRILAFAVGKPSEAFGEPYRVFDEKRVIARLPGPPYQFLDRITRIQAEPWKMVAGGVIEAEYDVPPDAWYFADDRQGVMPFAVLLESALQPCGWLAAYMGSALTSATDLSFRNLGGSTHLHGPVTPDTGTLTTTVKIARVSHSAGMIVQHFEFSLRAREGVVYEGETTFGFFSRDALARQVGLREAMPYQPDSAESARGCSLDYPTDGPFPTGRLRLVEQIDLFLPDGGPQGLGFISGSYAVDPGAWFFKAHFYQDPVCPGSIGLESYLQLLRYVAHTLWDGTASASYDVTPGQSHRWIYRGQVVPTSKRVVVQAVVTAVDHERRTLKADGFLSVDGRLIYQMSDFGLRMRTRN
jgi:acyl transferase domain-containing protein/3-hydroxymyristoyl/3-hydroxydecanoyl-(acyl carrier protein) dehydratase